MYLKSAAMLFLKSSAIIYGMGLSNELLIIIIAQGASNLGLAKVRVRKKNFDILGSRLCFTK